MLERATLSLQDITLASVLVVFLIIGVIGIFRILRRLETMQSTITQLQTTTQSDIHQIRVAQSSTQATVSATQQETQLFIQDLKTVQTTSLALMQEVKTLQSSSQALMIDWQKETVQLSRALRTSYHQGVWGERELGQVIRLAGMTEHCDFDVKPRLPNGQIPDLVVHLHDGHSIAIDAKAPSQAYLDAMSHEDEKIRTDKLKVYARSVRDRMNDLARKEYWAALESSLTLVILFIPNEAMFRAALEYDLALLDVSIDRHVLLASPITLIALLKAISHGWSQHKRAENVQHIVDQSKVLHKELETWLRQWQQLRKVVNDVTTEFNRVAVSYETTILPVVKELSSFDDTSSFNKKGFDLKVLRENVKPPEERKETGVEGKNGMLQKTFMLSFDKLKGALSLNVPHQEKEPGNI